MNSKLLSAFFLGLAFSVTASARAADGVSFDTQEGRVLGQKTAIAAFYPNIPYAQPPVGPLRWKAPRPPMQRQNVWDGSNIQVKCAQLAAYFSGTTDDSQLGRPTGSEDCLYLNIWRPQVTKLKKLPVLVWFHGGSNRQGYASDPMYDGEQLAAKTESIVVTVNYRLDLFGAFYNEALHTDNAADSSGNYVTLDAIQALKWIRANVGVLGGDTSRITLAGESAGCVNIWGLMLSPLAKGLFSQAYCSSGFPNSYPLSDASKASNDTIKKALVLKRLAPDLGAADKLLSKMTAAQIRDFLYSLSTAEILQLPTSIFSMHHFADGNVLPAEGLAGIGLGAYNVVPMLISTNATEGSYFFLQASAGITKMDFWKIQTGQIAPTSLQTFVGSKDFENFNTKSERFTHGINELVDSILLTRQVFPGPVYRMQWDWTSQREPWHSALGTCHGIDLPLVFYKKDVGSRSFLSFLNQDLKNPAVAQLSDKFLTYLKGFLYKGDPNAYAEKLPQWHSWNSLLPNNMTFSREELSEKFHYVNTVTGSMDLARAIYDLSQQTNQGFDQQK